MDDLADSLTQAFRKGLELGGSLDMPAALSSFPPLHHEKTTKVEANYRRSVTPNESCDRCTFFQSPSSCSKVAGTIRPVDVCDLFKEK